MGVSPLIFAWYSIGLLLVVSLLLFLRVKFLCPFHTTGMPFSSLLLSGGIACRGRSGHRLLVPFLPILDNASGALLWPGSCRRIGRCYCCARMPALLSSAVSSSLAYLRWPIAVYLNPSRHGRAWHGRAVRGVARRCTAWLAVRGLAWRWPGMARRGLVGVCGFSDFKTAFAFLVVIFYFPPSRHGVARHGQAGLRYAAQGMASLCFGNPLFSCFIGSFRLLACWAVRALFAVRQCRFGVGRVLLLSFSVCSFRI